MKVYNYGNDYAFQMRQKDNQQAKPAGTEQLQSVENDRDKVYGGGEGEVAEAEGTQEEAAAAPAPAASSTKKKKRKAKEQEG